jgi:hypothetical protein
MRLRNEINDNNIVKNLERECLYLIVNNIRQLLFSGSLLKSASTSRIQHSSKRFIFLISDVIIIASSLSSGSAGTQG